MSLKLTMDFIDNNLAVTVNKRNVKTINDKEILRNTLLAMCNFKSTESHITLDEIDECLNDNDGIYISFIATSECLEIYYNTKKSLR